MWRFHCRFLLRTRVIADRFKEFNIFQLKFLELSLFAQENLERGRCRRYCNRKRLKTARVKRMAKNSTERQTYDRYWGKILKLAAQRERINECLNARHLLRTRTDYIFDIGRILQSIGKHIRLAVRAPEKKILESHVI